VITLDVRVIPRARKTECAGFKDDVLDRGRQKRVAIEGVTREQIPWSRTS
jgi:uncharacterized protein YggU (UPF0235/DUF167 family)